MSPGIFLPTLVFTLGILAIQLMWCIAVPFCQRLFVSAAARVIRARHSPPWRTGPLGAGQFCPDRDTERVSIMCAQVLTAFRPASAQVLLVFSAVFLFAIATPGMVHHVASAAWLPIGTDLQRMHTFVSAQRNGTFRSTMPVLELSSPRLQLLAQDCAAIWWAKALQTPMRSRARKAGSKVRSTPNQRRAHTAGLKARSPLMHAAIRGSTSVLPPAASSSISTASTTTSPNYLGGVGLTVSST